VWQARRPCGPVVGDGHDLSRAAFEALIRVTWLLEPDRAGQRYVHLTWDDVLPLYRKAWGGASDPRIQRYLDVLQQALGAPCK
jgi:hypothetical protein